MKTLILLRHAKSSWSDNSLADRHRPLNDRGRRDIPTIGDRLAARKLVPDMIASSPAERALQTAMQIAPFLNLPSSRINVADELYLADTDVLLSIVQLCDSNVDTLMLVGHNPGITEFANSLTDVPVDHMPTCAAFICRFDVKHWHDVSLSTGDYVALEHP